jgi:hypothetical protein
VAALIAAAGLALPASAASPWTVGTGPNAGQARARPVAAAPTGVTTACGGGGLGTITVSWNTDSTATSYRVQVSTTSSTAGFDAGTNVAPAAAATTSYVFNAGGLLATFRFRVWSYTGTWASPTAANATPSRSITLGLLCG